MNFFSNPYIHFKNSRIIFWNRKKDKSTDYADNWIYYASDIKEVLKIIESKIENPTIEDVDGLWEKNGSVNFLRELKKIIEY